MSHRLAWLHRSGPLVGVLGSVLVAWGACEPEGSHGPDGWPSAAVNAIGRLVSPLGGRALVAVGFAVICLAWWLVNADSRERPIRLGLVFALWCLPLLLVPPVLSGDAALYANIGWILHDGGNPYEVGLGTTGGPLAAQLDPIWFGTGAPYPPLALRVDQLVVWLTGTHPYLSIIGMRIPAVLSIVAIHHLVARIAPLVGRPVTEALWMGVFNPVMLVHVVGGAHNDGPMIALSLLAIWLVLRFPGRWSEYLWAPTVVGVAIAFKPQSVLTVVAVAGLPIVARLVDNTRWGAVWRFVRRAVPVTAVAVLAFLLATLCSGLGFGWTTWVPLGGEIWTFSPMPVLERTAALMWSLSGGSFAGGLAVAEKVGLVVLGAALLAIGIRFVARPLSMLAWAALLVAVFGPAFHPWYVVWGLAVLSLAHVTARQRWVTFVLAVLIRA